MGLFGSIGGAIKGAFGGGGGTRPQGQGGGFKQAMQQRGIGPSAPPQDMPQSPMPDVPMGNPNQDTLPQPRQGGWGNMGQPDVMPPNRGLPTREMGPPDMGGFKEMLMRRQAAMGQMGQGGNPYMSVPQGQFSSGQVGQGGNFGQALQGMGQMYGQMAGGMQGPPQGMPPQAQMGRGQMKQQQMGLGPSPQMGQRPMPQRGGNFGQGTGGRMNPQMGGQRPMGNGLVRM